ncbi:MAG: nucleoside triphosphate pyrophosphatase [Parvularculaceae bacterium]
MANATLILASGSAIRAKILREAGVDFEVITPDVDEAAAKAALVKAGAGLEEIAMKLAEAKARSVIAPGRLVLGADQILEHQGRFFDKPKNIAEAKARLLELQGDVHTLINAVAVARDGAIVFRHLDRPRLTMRPMTEHEIDRYFDRAGAGVLASVGAYQVEALGAHLFERIEGDHFAVLGLALFPVLGFLRAQGIGAI